MDITMGLLLILIGIIAGGYGTIVGAGGGFILVPALLLIFQLDPAVAAASGLVTVLINSLSGVFGYAKQEKIQYRTGLTIGIGAFPGSILGVMLLQLYASSSFTVILASLLVGLGLFLFWKNSSFLKKKAHVPVHERDSISEQYAAEAAIAAVPERTAVAPKSVFLVPLGFLMGILSSYLGIGGGWLLVPVLIYVFKVPTHNATATSIFSLTLYSAVGVVSQLFYGQIDWSIVLFGGIGVIIGSQLGVYLSKLLPGKVVIQMLSVLLVAIGIRMYFG
ncbi:sulfite exporter TauE/SafE family protein [Terribacillus saccharophilus]|uniref:sulfite exporter TauE/SafE family protein n=1 Tax=Terribacillus saccharophilus TaxID=361277 RepID=UPI002DCF1577|nr:sulfite exporter TauE/SafE family protein [Terribacillus saccharophilus]MEC0289468.1 sulfite exporter TauE/SafE family protein [Terribacillus saccharophilus]